MRRWRVGTISMGVLLVATGLLLFISELNGTNGAGMILRWWPMILVVLGIEILAYVVFSREEQPKIKFDGLSIFLAVLIILVSTGIYGVNTFMKSGFSQGIFGDMGVFKNQSLVNKSWDLEAADVKKLQIDSSRGEIQVDAYDGDKIKVDVAIMVKNNDEEQALKLAQDLVEVTEGETVTLSTGNLDVLENNRNYQFNVNIAVKVPKALEFDIQSKFGEITLEDLTGNVKVDSKFGKIEIENIQGDVQVENDFGEIRMKDIFGKMDIENNQGEISYRSTKVANEDITLNTKMGGVNLSLPRTQQGTFDLRSAFGGIQIEGFPTSISINKDNMKQEWKGTIGTSSPVITINTEHGEIMVNGK